MKYLLRSRKTAVFWKILICFLFHCSLDAQSFSRADALTVEDGLPFRDVTAVVQDERGLLWFGTPQGLTRYDGYHFIDYELVAERPMALSGQSLEVEDLVAVAGNQLLVLGKERLFRLDLSANTTTVFRPVLESGTAPCGDVVQVEKTRDGFLWIVCGADHQQFLLRCTLEGRCRLIDSVGIREQGFTSLESDTLGQVWWSTEAEGLRRYSGSGDLRQRIRPDSFIWYGKKLYFTLSFIDSRNRHFLFPKSRNEVLLYQDSLNAFLPFLTTPDVVYHALEDHLGNLWFATRDQLLRLDESGEVSDVSNQLKEVMDFSNIQDLFEDQARDLWVATNNGLIRLPVRPASFTRHLQAEGKGWGNTIRGFWEDKDGNVFLVVESQGLLYRISPATQQAEVFSIPGLRSGRFGTLEHVRYLAASAGSDCIFMANDHLLKVRLSDGRLWVDSTLSDVLNPVTPNPLIALSDGRLVMGYELDKLTVFDPQTGERRRVLAPGSVPKSGVSTKFLLEDSHNRLWVGTMNDGLYQVTLSGKIEAHFSTATSPALSNDHVMALAEDSSGIIWVGTFGGGLNRIDPQAGEIVFFSQRDGLCNDNVVGMLPYGDRYLWVSTYNGLSCLDKRDGIFRNYFEEDGLTHDEFNYTSFFQDSWGRFYFGGMNGVNVFHPSDIVFKEPAPPLTLTRFLKYDRRRDTLITWHHQLEEGREYVISPYDSYFQFDWTLPQYFNAKKNQYHTVLEGYEKEWIFQGHNAFLRYNRLPAGLYTLRIKGSDPRGNESRKELAITIRVKPFFYETWWFMLLLIGLLAALVYAWLQYRLQQMARIEQIRNRIAGDLHDDVGGLLSGLAMQAEVMEMKARPEDRSRLRQLSELSREAISQMRDLVWAINSQRDSTTDLVERIREHAEETLLPRNISFTLETERMPPDKKLSVEIRQHLYLILKEALTNVVRHSNATQVRIRMGNYQGKFEMDIHDNGRSLRKWPESTGIGLSNMKMRAGKIGAELSLEHSDGFRVHLRRKAL